MCKITFNVKETTKYYFGKIEKHENGKNKKGTRMVKDGDGLTRIANDHLEKFGLNVSICTNRDATPLIQSLLTSSIY